LDTPPRSLFSKILWAFIRIGSVNVLAKFEVRIALPVAEIRGVAKLQTPNLEEGEAIGGRGWYIRKSVGQFLLAVDTYYSSISTRLPDILDCRFHFSVRGCEPPILGKGRPYGGRGWYRSKERW